MTTRDRLAKKNPKFVEKQEKASRDNEQKMQAACTFRPDLSRTSKKYKASAQSTYFSTAATQVLTHSAQSESRPQYNNVNTI